MNILIIKVAAIGDVIMALPILSVIKKKYPGAKVTWICGRSAVSILRQFEIDEIIEVDDGKLLAGNLFSKITEMLKLWGTIFGRNFGLVITGHVDPRYRLMSLPIFAKERRSFGKINGRFWPVPGRHHTDEYIRLVTNTDGCPSLSSALPILKISLPENIKKEINTGINSKFVALAPGGAKNIMRDEAIRRWPIENYVELARELIIRGIKVILTGANTDKWVQDYFLGLDIIDLIGKTSLKNLIALYGNCDVIVTHDSGPLHLAGLSGSNVIALFGPTIPSEKIPRAATTVIWGGGNLACRPCYDGKTYANCCDNKCLKEITVEKVYDAVISKLK